MSTKSTHFVVEFNHETGKFSIDWETTDSKFQDGVVYNHVKQQWMDRDELSLSDIGHVNAAEDALNTVFKYILNPILLREIHG